MKATPIKSRINTDSSSGMNLGMTPSKGLDIHVLPIERKITCGIVDLLTRDSSPAMEEDA